MPRLAAHAVESVRALPERHGRVTLAVLLLILALGFGLRIERVIDPNAHPGDDALAYTALAGAAAVWTARWIDGHRAGPA